MSPFWGKSTPGTDGGASSKRRYWISAVVGVVILAAVMLAFAAFGPLKGSSKQAVKPIVLAQQEQQKSTELTAQGEAALASGDTTAAAALAAQAIALNPENVRAKLLAANVKKKVASSSASPGTPAPGTPASATPDAFLNDVTNMALLLPASFPGYDLGQADVTGADAIVSGTPRATSGNAPRLVWAVHQTASAAEAQQFVTRVSKSAYGEDSASVEIGGVSGYFGTDGTRFATISYVRGKYVFELLATSSGTAPVNLKSIAVKAAEAFADVPPN